MRQVPGFDLWIGHAGDVRDAATLLASGISAVVGLALEEPSAPLPRELISCRFPLIDGPGNPGRVAGALRRPDAHAHAALRKSTLRTLRGAPGRPASRGRIDDESHLHGRRRSHASWGPGRGFRRPARPMAT